MSALQELLTADAKRWKKMLGELAGKHRPFTRRAMNANERHIQRVLSSRPARQWIPRIEKKLIDGVWVRPTTAETPQ